MLHTPGIAERFIDNDRTIRVTNLDALPRGLGLRYLLVVESPYAGEYVAKKWMRKLPASVGRCEWIVRF